MAYHARPPRAGAATIVHHFATIGGSPPPSVGGMAPTTETLVETRLALQAVAEHVVSAARHRATGRIGLRPSPGGFTTPTFPSDLGPRAVAVDGTELVVRDGGGERRAPLTTVGELAAVVGIEPGAPLDVYTPTTPLAPDAPLAVDGEAAELLADWWALTAAALGLFLAAHPELSPTEPQLWPEHFDLGAQMAEVNYGGSPGDAGSPRPYLYVGPWEPPEPDGEYWNRPFGAAVDASEITSVDQAVAFFEAGLSRRPPPHP